MIITKEAKVMKTSLTKVIIIVSILCTSVSLAGLPKVIGNFEDSNDGWMVHPDAPDGTTAHFVKENATLGDYSLKVIVPTGWQKAITKDFTDDANTLADITRAKQLKMDITLKAKEWSVSTGWVKAVECIVLQSDMGAWQQIDPTDGETGWDGQADKTVTVTFDIPVQGPPDLTHATFIIVTNYDGVEKAGPFYFDNIRLVGGEPNKPAEAAKPAEPAKTAEPNKPAEQKKSK